MAGLERDKGPSGSPGRFRIRGIPRLLLATLVIALLAVPSSSRSAVPVKTAVFNFSARNLEASGYGTTVTNTLLVHLKNRGEFSVLDRKELESFLAMNDLRQDEHLDNVALIGNRLGLNIIVTGSVERNGTILTIRCNVVQVEQKKPILDVRLTAFGDEGLARELNSLGDMIAGAVTDLGREREDAFSLRAPVNIRKKSGNMKIQLSWENPPGAAAIAGWEVFRGTSPEGPFARIAQVNRSEFWDQAVERNRTYHYKVRSFSSRGGYSEFSAVVAAESAPTPNPPVILRADSRVRSVQLVLLPSPARGDDPFRFKGYRLYRAGEEGPFRELKNIPVPDARPGMDAVEAGKVIAVDSAIRDGERYYYRATAYNEKELESDYSRALIGSALPRVQDVRAEGERIREIPLSWRAVPSPFIRGYHVYRSESPGGNFAVILSIPTTEAGTDSRVSVVDAKGLGDRKTYYYRVTAYEEGGAETTPSETASAVTRGRPPTPRDFRAEVGRVKRIPLAWQPSALDDVLGYRIYRSVRKEGPFESLRVISGRQSDGYVDDGGALGDGTAYFYRITAYNRVDAESEPSEVVTAATKARPKPPAGFRGETEGGKAVLRWQANAEPDIARYDIFERSYFGLEKIAAATGTFHSLGDMTKGKSRVFCLRAVDRSGLESEASPEITVTAP
ncbi:MAG: hypothetical protein HPY65_06765 [Syntrophaceae bacterium]|nr:hypothetical protein [Syntrophaceae bacterium]